LVPKGVFDQSIFEGMECDDDCPPLGVQSVGKDCAEKGLEVFQLAVDGDSQGLEYPGGRMSLGPPAIGIEDFVDGFDKVGRSANGLASAANRDRVSNRSAGRLFAEPKEEIRQFALVGGRKELGRRRPLRGIKSHVERTGSLKAEAACGIGQLIRRKPEIEQDSVDPFDAELFQDFRQLGIAGLIQHAARVVQDLGRLSEHHWVAIESDQFSGGTEVFEENAAVTAGSDRAVHHDQSRRNLEELNDFPHKDGTVNRRAPVSRGSHRIRHSGGLMNEEWKLVRRTTPPRESGLRMRRRLPRGVVVRKIRRSENPKMVNPGHSPPREIHFPQLEANGPLTDGSAPASTVRRSTSESPFSRYPRSPVSQRIDFV
jgi:hypothetical protein